MIGGQCTVRAIEKHDQQQETRLLIDELEQSLSRNPIIVFGEHTPDETQGPLFIKLAGDQTLDEEQEFYLSTAVIKNGRETAKLDSLAIALDSLSVHMDTRTALVSSEDRYAINAIILKTRTNVSTLNGLRRLIADGQEGTYAVGLAEPQTAKFFTRLRDSVDWLRD